MYPSNDLLLYRMIQVQDIYIYRRWFDVFAIIESQIEGLNLSPFSMNYVFNKVKNESECHSYNNENIF